MAAYSLVCHLLGLKDRQVPKLGPLTCRAWAHLLGHVLMLLVLLPFALPGGILNVPPAAYAGWVARTEMKKAVAKSR